mgnify:CR=1 FL=1
MSNSYIDDIHVNMCMMMYTPYGIYASASQQQRILHRVIDAYFVPTIIGLTN